VRLEPIARNRGLKGWGKLRALSAKVDAAFTPKVDAAVARSLERRR
jgi:hypothetical protein